MRASGILLPIFSLPGNYGIGCFSKEAYNFIDFLERCGQKYWQILPIGPVGPGYSPYQAVSTFAIEPLFIDLEKLIEDKLLTKEECEELYEEEYCGDVDYEKLMEIKMPLLEKAYKRFSKLESSKEYEKFCESEKDWLDAYAKFMKKEGLYKFLQYTAYTQWKKLKKYANAHGVLIIGDVPIYVAPDGEDVLSNPKLFKLDKSGKPGEVAGCPPDGYAPGGQKWGNPLYDWEYHKKTGYEWWIKRIKNALSLFDVIRIDHFRGFDEFFAIPAKDEDAKNGVWKSGPGMDLFNALEKSLGKLPVIAENLGFLTDSVEKLLTDSGFPGMKIVQFAFSGDEQNFYLPHLYGKNCVVYTGTHDNNTTLGWIKSLPPYDRQHITNYLDIEFNTSDEELLDYMISLAMSSCADTCIIPLQDYLGYGSEARINTPSTMNINWMWRVDKDALEPCVENFIRAFTKETNRLTQ